MNNQYAVSIRHIYTMPDETFNGYELLNEGWQILRVDTMPPTELRNNAVAATNVYILEREANDD